MIDKLKELEAKLAQDETLAAQFKEALEAAKADETKSDIESLCAAAAKIGFDITAEQAEKVIADSQVLSDEDLEGISGGLWGDEGEDGHSRSCLFVWHCEVVALHTETTDKKCDCWTDYSCSSNPNYRYSCTNIN